MAARPRPTRGCPVAICNGSLTSIRDVASNVSNAQIADVRRGSSEPVKSTKSEPGRLAPRTEGNTHISSPSGLKQADHGWHFG